MTSWFVTEFRLHDDLCGVAYFPRSPPETTITLSSRNQKGKWIVPCMETIFGTTRKSKRKKTGKGFFWIGKSIDNLCELFKEKPHIRTLSCPNASSAKITQQTKYGRQWAFGIQAACWEIFSSWRKIGRRK